MVSQCQTEFRGLGRQCPAERSLGELQRIESLHISQLPALLGGKYLSNRLGKPTPNRRAAIAPEDAGMPNDPQRNTPQDKAVRMSAS